MSVPIILWTGAAFFVARSLMYPDFLRDRADVEALISGLKQARHIISQPALARYSGAELSPGPAVKSDADLETFIRSTGEATTGFALSRLCFEGPAEDLGLITPDVVALRRTIHRHPELGLARRKRLVIERGVEQRAREIGPERPTHLYRFDRTARCGARPRR